MATVIKKDRTAAPDHAVIKQIMKEEGVDLPRAIGIYNQRLKEEEGESILPVPKLEKSILLAYAKGVLPSIIAHELDITIHEVERIIKEGKKEVERLTDIVGSSYQAVRMNNLFDVGLVKMEEQILEGSAEDKKFLDIMQELLKWRKAGDLEKIFDQRSLNETYLDVPSSVGEIDEKIAQLEKELKLR